MGAAAHGVSAHKRNSCRRHFLYGKHYARDFVSVTFGDGGIGKSALKLVEILAMITGRNLIGITPTERVRCFYWNGDDPLVEVERRIHAVAKYFAIDLDELIREGWLFIGTSDDYPLIVAESHNGNIRITPHAVDDVCKMIVDNGIGFGAFDPIKSLHRLPENNTTEMDVVAEVFKIVAARTHVAIGLEHHVRKPAQGQTEVTSNDGRGSNALVNKIRLSRVLNVMSPAQAEQAGIPEDKRRFHFRADSGKLQHRAAAGRHLVQADQCAVGKRRRHRRPRSVEVSQPLRHHQRRTDA